MSPQAPTAEQMQSGEGMAYGGITNLPVQDMNFGSGGIVAFANDKGEQVVEDKDKSKLNNLLSRMFNYKNEMSKLEERDKDPESLGPAMLSKGVDYVTLPSSEYDVKYPDVPTVKPVPLPVAVETPAAVVKPPSVKIAPPRQVASAAQPVTPAAPIDQGLGSFPQNTAMPTNVAPGIANIAMPDRNTALLAAEGKDPYLKKQPGEIMEKYLERMTARDEEGKQRFQKQEEAQNRSDLWKALIEGGESTRGITGKGIAGLGTGFGKSTIASAEAARQRATAQANLEREHEDNMVKVNQEIENARILRANGRFDEAFKAQQKADEIANMDRRELQKFAQDEKLAGMRFGNEKDLAKIRFDYERDLKKIPQAQKATLDEQYVTEMVKKGIPREQAIREIKTMGTQVKRELTINEATDNVDNFLKNNPTFISNKISQAKKNNQPIPDAFDIRNELINKTMKDAGAKNETPDKIKDLVKQYATK
jgi:tetratricopeptide (TPR) repeat protein